MKKKVWFFICILIFAYTLVFANDFSSSAFTTLNALRVAYNGDVTQIWYDSNKGDWCIEVAGTTLLWAQGRLLPEEKLPILSKYHPFVSYQYALQKSDPATFSAEKIAYLAQMGSAQKRAESQINSDAFLNALYNGSTLESIDQEVRKTTFLGFKVTVHKKIAAALKKVEQHIREAALTDADTHSFIQNILRVDGFNWREIVDTYSRSMHSWGIAIDILPIGWGNKIVYWQWENVYNAQWMLIPQAKRWAPPETVIQAFEAEGFIWGGKWELWDNMHFEYRPELLVLQKR